MGTTDEIGLEIRVDRGKVAALADLPPRSIALDGYVQGPELDLENQRLSFDHHDRCLRLVTRATCQQVLDALLLGFDPAGHTAFVNDVDGDTALSIWLLRNPGRAGEPEVRRLVESVGGVDAHGPAYPALDPDLAEAFFARAMAPEQRARNEGTYPGADLPALLEECVERIDAFVAAGLPTQAVREATEFRIARTGASGWVLVECHGFAFRDLYARGFTRAAVYHALPDGSWRYTLGRKSDLVAGFPVGPASVPGTLLHSLAAEEPGWGGGSSIGGSPRNPDGSSSRIPPEGLFERIEDLLGNPEA